MAGGQRKRRVWIAGAAGAILVAALMLAAGGLWHLHTRALPQPLARAVVQGVSGRVEIIWDTWGVPHITAGNEPDAAFGLGWAVARDRLFQIVLVKYLTQGRLAELFGSDALKADKLFRTMDFYGTGRGLAARSSPQVRALFHAYTQGVNAYAARLGGNLPIEFALLRIGWEPLADDDLVGVTAFMSWNLHDSWKLDPLYHHLEEKLGPERAARLFPDARIAKQVGRFAGLPGQTTVFEQAAASPWADLISPPLSGSNSWAVAPSRSATGHALLSSDPHLGLGLPSIWYEAHLVTPTMEVAGVTLPGQPLIVIGHNRRIAWGMTTLMTDAGDYFLERLEQGPPLKVQSKGRWVPVTEQKVTLHIRGGGSEEFTIRRTPHGPLVADLLPGEKDALAYEWVPFADPDSNDLEAFYRLDKAGSWKEFRSAVSLMGAVAQNITYADREGHIGMQTSGRVPVRKGGATGLKIRSGWDGSQDWAGFVPFDRMPSAYDPARGWVESSNNLPFDKPTPFYLAARFEPKDRYRRVSERLSSETHWTPEGFSQLENDILWPTAREWAPRIVAACGPAPAANEAPLSATEARALALLKSWDGQMQADRPAPALFAEFFRQWYAQTYAKELGEPLMKEVAEISNLPADFLAVAWDTLGGSGAAPPLTDAQRSMVCGAFRGAVDTLAGAQGSGPEDWRWGKQHELTLGHPLSRVKVLGWYFSRGPYPRPGSAETVNKEQTDWGGTSVRVGASTRQIVDLGDPAHAWAVMPGGQSGIPASPHYNDQTALWLNGATHASWMDRADIEQHATERTELVPAEAKP